MSGQAGGATDRLTTALAPWRQQLGALAQLGPAPVVACSGGTDSLALLALACAATPSGCVAVYVDHELRSTSAHDGEVVVGAAQALGADARIVAAPVDAGPGVEARARDARYAALEAVRVRVGAAVVLVGHTADDQAETVLLNLLRGAGSPGLAGMPARRDTIVRPLLGLRRADTAEICARLGLVPVHDAMNDDTRYRRVLLRRELIPALCRTAARDLVPVLARQADVLRAESELLDRLAVDAWPGPGGALASALHALDPVLGRRAVRCWIGSPPPSQRDVDAVLAVAAGGSPAGATLAGRRRVSRSGGVLRVERTEATAPDRAPVPLALPGSATAHGVRVEAWVEREPPADWPDGRSACVVDAEVVGPAAQLQRTAASEVNVLQAGTGETVWRVGYGTAGWSRVSWRTRRFLWIKAGPVT